MKRKLVTVSIVLLSIVLAGCGNVPVSVNTAATAAASFTPPPAVNTAVSGAQTAVASVTVPAVLLTAAATVSPPPVTAHPITPLPPEVASQVITIYAAHQLGLQDLQVIRAIGAQGELNLPSTTQANVQAALDLAGTSYAALLSGGVGLVAMGGAETTGDVTAQIDWASLGVFSLRTTEPYPADATGALALVKRTYPGLEPYDMAPQTVERGFAFSATTTTSAVDPSTGESQNVGKVVIGGVIQADTGGLVFVYAIVGNGSLSVPLEP